MPDDDTAHLITAALICGDRRLLVRARGLARTTRDRQLTAIATAHLDRDVELLDALVRDHLADHPDSALAAWTAAPAAPREDAARAPRTEKE